MVVQGASLAEVQGKAASQTPPPIEARGKSPAAPGADAPTSRAGVGAVSPGGSSVLSPYGTMDALQGKRARKGSPTYVQCI